MPNIQVTLVSSGQVRLHLKYAALQLGLDRVGVAAAISGSPRNHRAVLFDCSKSTTVPDNVIDAASQLILHRVGVAAINCMPPRDDGAVFLHGGKSTPVPIDVGNTASQLILTLSELPP